MDENKTKIQDIESASNHFNFKNEPSKLNKIIKHIARIPAGQNLIDTLSPEIKISAAKDTGLISKYDHENQIIYIDIEQPKEFAASMLMLHMEQAIKRQNEPRPKVKKTINLLFK